MSYLITPAHRTRVLSLSAAERHFYFIDKVVANQSLCTLMKGEELLPFRDADDRLCIPVWPHPEYAKVLATGTWKNAATVNIDLDSFLERTLPSCVDDDVHFLVFPISDKKGAVLAAKELQRELSEAVAHAKEAQPRTLDDLPEPPEDFIAQL